MQERLVARFRASSWRFCPLRPQPTTSAPSSAKVLPVGGGTCRARNPPSPSALGRSDWLLPPLPAKGVYCAPWRGMLAGTCRRQAVKLSRIRLKERQSGVGFDDFHCMGPDRCIQLVASALGPHRRAEPEDEVWDAPLSLYHGSVPCPPTAFRSALPLSTSVQHLLRRCRPCVCVPSLVTPVILHSLPASATSPSFFV